MLKKIKSICLAATAFFAIPIAVITAREKYVEAKETCKKPVGV